MKIFLLKLSMVFFLATNFSHGSNKETEIEGFYNKTTPLVPKDTVGFISSAEVDLSQAVEGVLYLKDDVEIGENALIRYGLVHRPGLSFEEETEVSVTFYYMKKADSYYLRDNLLLHIVASFERWEGLLPACYRIGDVTEFDSEMKNLVQYDVFFELDRIFATHPDLSEGLFAEEISDYAKEK